MRHPCRVELRVCTEPRVTSSLRSSSPWANMRHPSRVGLRHEQAAFRRNKYPCKSVSIRGKTQAKKICVNPCNPWETYIASVVPKEQISVQIRTHPWKNTSEEEICVNPCNPWETYIASGVPKEQKHPCTSPSIRGRIQVKKKSV